jgi:hypothetical protein
LALPAKRDYIAQPDAGRREEVHRAKRKRCRATGATAIGFGMSIAVNIEE